MVSNPKRPSRRSFGLLSSLPRLSIQTYAQKVLLFAILSLAGLSIYRFYDYWTTGFFVADEFGYYFDALHGQVYGFRWFFGWLNIILFKLLDIHSVSRYAFFLPFYLFIWGCITILAFYKTLKTLGFDDTTSAVSVLSSFILVSFVLLSLGFLTEPVGLSFAMLGIYFLVKLVKSTLTKSILAYSAFSSLSFGAAANSREPYIIFLIGGIVIVPYIFWRRKKDSGYRSREESNLALGSSAIFVILSVAFLWSNPGVSSQIPPIFIDLIQAIFPAYVPPPIPATTVTSSTFSFPSFTFRSLTLPSVTSTITTVITSSATITFTSSGQVTSTVSTFTTTLTTIAPPPQPPFPFLSTTRGGNTLLIFFGGLLLGWGPIAFITGAIGLFLLLRELKKGRALISNVTLLLSLLALGSYFVVSFVFSTDAFYLTFTNYSTIIRFSDTALPAYFLLAPFAIGAVAKRGRKYALGIIALFFIFIMAAVPVYQSYASSTLISYTGSNPFALNYRTDAVLIRDYILSHERDAPFYIIGWPSAWDFTPGTDLLPPVGVYTPFPNPFIPYLSHNHFLANKWSAFYVYNPNSLDFIRANAPYLVQFVSPNEPSSNSTVPYTVVSREVVMQNPSFTLTKVQLSWHQ